MSGKTVDTEQMLAQRAGSLPLMPTSSPFATAESGTILTSDVGLLHNSTMEPFL